MTDMRARLVRELHADYRRRWHQSSAGTWGPEHVVDLLLALPGIAIVELPEAIRSKPGWADFGRAQVDDRVPGQVAYFTANALAGTWTSMSEARALAAALLAAAKVTKGHL